MKIRKITVEYGYKKRILMIEGETEKAYLVRPKGEINLWLPKSKMNCYVISGKDFDYFYNKEIKKMQSKDKEIIVQYSNRRKVFKVEAETEKAYLIKPNDEIKLWLPKRVISDPEIYGELIIDGDTYNCFYENELIKNLNTEDILKIYGYYL